MLNQGYICFLYIVNLQAAQFERLYMATIHKNKLLGRWSLYTIGPDNEWCKCIIG